LRTNFAHCSPGRQNTSSTKVFGKQATLTKSWNLPPQLAHPPTATEIYFRNFSGF